MSDDKKNPHILEPTKFDINKFRRSSINVTNDQATPDQFGQQYNADYDRSKWSDEVPQDSRRYHTRSDTDVGPRSLHHTLGPGRNQASPGNHNHDGTTAKKLFQSGTALISFVSLGSFTQAVLYDEPYPTSVIPRVFVNLASGAGVTSRWAARAIGPFTNTGFTVFVYRGDAADPVNTWTDIPVYWLAIP